MELDSLRLHAIPGSVEILNGGGGLPMLRLLGRDSTVDVYPHGAHVASFVPKGGRDALFMSGKSYFADGKPIRGGVPLIFPWFGPNAKDASLPAHGFARTQSWSVASTSVAADGSVSARFELKASDATRKLWPHAFSLAFTVTAGKSLSMSLEVRNTGDEPFTFEEALHTYLAVPDVRQVAIDGLKGRTYLDKMAGAARTVQTESPFGIVAETDRVYLDTPDAVHVTLPGHLAVTVAKKGSATTVVWNPWVAKAKAMADFGDDEWPRMLCVETANAASNAVTLAAGATHVMTATVTVG